ncbi:MAG: hypothetical protein K9I68_01540 [Bacteroidales bacterium]|nr:hypothetical protein [Bacteroidales bacterium]MCF8337070.1 hypothetical protein [Bacteroidales bacterium]
MKRKIIAFFIGTAFFIGAIGFGITSESESKLLINNSEALAEDNHENDEKICMEMNDTYCEYADGTPSEGPVGWRDLDSPTIGDM